MQQENDPLDLRSLPLAEPPSDDWPVIEAALRQDLTRRRLWKVAGGALAAAATVTLVVGIVVQRPEAVPTAAPVATETRMAAAAGPVTSQDNLESLIGLSQQLERSLRNIRAEVGSMPTDTVVYQVELEDLVAQVDDALSLSPDSTDLWYRRINLLLDLNHLYRNQLRREYSRMASL